MPMRVNAGLGMARMTVLVDEIALSHAPHAVGAVGHCDVYPNSRNIIPGRAVFTADFRHPDKAVIADMEARFRGGAKAIADDIGLGDRDRVRSAASTPSPSTRTCVAAVRSAAERLGYAHRDIVSGAGHDACWINRVAPTAMVMCPCVDGLSHNEAEEISPEWASAGADVLFHAVVETAGDRRLTACAIVDLPPDPSIFTSSEKSPDRGANRAWPPPSSRAARSSRPIAPTSRTSRSTAGASRASGPKAAATCPGTRRWTPPAAT